MERTITIGGVRMKRVNRGWLALIACFVSLWIQAQDSIPSQLDIALPAMEGWQVHDLNPSSDTIPLQIIRPDVFVGTGANSISDPKGVLDSLMVHFKHLLNGSVEDSVRIVHIGDSHVRGHIYPQTVGKLFTDTFGKVSYTDMGVNGATCLTFTHPGRIEAIVELKPELLILSFGTNESHNPRYNPDVHYRQMDELVALLRNKLPGVPVLLTTPPGSYESLRKNNNQRAYSINPRTETAVKTICHFAEENGLAVWNMYATVGGLEYACRNWKAAKLMFTDHVHYTSEGYTLQGELLYEALIKSYNEYVSR